MLCILYVIALSTLLGLTAALIEQTLPPTAPRRWLWLAAVTLSVTLPPLYAVHHHAVVAGTAAELSGFDTEVLRAWLVSTIALGLWGIAAALRLAWLLPARGGPVLVHPRFGPATVGVLRPRVVIPVWVLALPDGERHDVLRHEAEHRRARDPLLLLLASLTLLLTPWNVALWWLLWRLRLAVEIDCDNRVVAGRGDHVRYGELLVNVAARGTVGPRMQPAFLGSSGMLERRLGHLLDPRRLSRLRRILVLGLAGGVLLLAFATPHPVVRPHGKAPAAAASVPR
jgi:hypothetical protein